jgi:hypothetical protein
MDITPLQKWLSLPAGPWPPDDRALLGLPATGLVDADEAEQNALARMEWLRPHQLIHPELVTEGMNRLAQALIAVTSISTAPAPPPAPTPVQPTAAPASDDDLPPLIDSAYPEVSLASPVVAAPAPAPSSAPTVLVAEVVDAEIVPTTASKPPRPTVALTPTTVLLDDPAPILLADAPPPPGADRITSDRRRAYRELVFLRKLRRIWGQLGPIAGVPSEHLRTPEPVYLVLRNSTEMRTLFRSHPGAATILANDGRAVAAVFAQPQALRVFRDLVPSQRTALATDWAAGRSVIDTGYAALRASLRNRRPRNWLHTLAVVTRRGMRANPEWVLGALTLLLVLVGLGKVFFRGPQP